MTTRAPDATCRIRGGLVVDGTGGPARAADVDVVAGRIVAIGSADELGPPTGKVIDAAGLVVAPGFVDVHTHYDAQLDWDPAATPSCLHGVTSVIGGNCGFTLAPGAPEDAGYLTRLLARVEGMPLAALQEGLRWDWDGFGDWLGRREGGLAVNAGFLVGHSALRRAVLGAAASVRVATPQETAAMTAALREALLAGGLGFSTSTSPTHNDGDGAPVPSRLADRAELLALAGAVRDTPGTAVQLTLAGTVGSLSDEEMELMADLSLAADRPVNWNVLAVSAAHADSWRHQLEASDRAAARGGRVVALTMPHLMQIRLSFLTGFVLDALPGWKELFNLAPTERVSALGDPSLRARLDAGAQSDEAGMLRGLARWKNLRVVETFAPVNAGCDGRSVGDIATERGGNPFDVLLDIVMADDLRTGLMPPVLGDSDSDWHERAAAWHDERTVVGASDAGAHLDMMCGAVYSTTLLGEGVRERSLITLEEAVRQLTAVPAQLYGLRDRGQLLPGYAADLVLFDPHRIGPGPERTRYDLPAGAPRLYAEATGVHQVLVNGECVVRDGELTGSRSGTLLRSGRDTVEVRA